ncbi:RNA-dependent RNA polymerase [Thalictrum thalictroides]|uniref:RNA-dependent RNA polymerase n=1 Tax=Thalictrum thalictroides TaxID=46969 RepID=A0A7J6UYS4_THATH|nr:RNA-dependent RNA polymerase [Thalictrum thalictroides]
MSRTIQIFGFPSYVSAEEVTKFLENYTGKRTVFALKIRQPKRSGTNPKAYSIVQFTTTESSELMLSIINGRLNYQSYKLRVRKLDRDIVPNPREAMLTLETIALHFGCQTSEKRFHVFEKVENVVVNFGFHLRKVDFFLTYCDVDYKLELSYDSMWQIYERCPLSHSAKFLIIQLLAAPRLYEKCSSGHQHEDSHLNYFKNTPDENWVRTTDFTGLSCIGQCTSICLELQPNCKLECIREYFHYYKEDNSVFVVEGGSTFSHNILHGPTVNSPEGLELPYAINFKVNSLVQIGCLAGPTLDAAFFRLVHPRYTPINLIECALEKLYHIKDCCYDPVSWLNEQYATFRTSRKFHWQSAITLKDGLVYVRRVQVTPTKVYYCGPEIIVSNRVLRHFHEYIDNFIRVSFVDEDGERMRSSDLSPRALTNNRHTTLYDRVLSTLSNGIVIGTKKFDFLAFSSSQLRENSVWMFASRDGITTASTIRGWMGDFQEIRNVAKHAARLGQSFGSSTETLTVARHEIEIIPDVETRWNGNNYVFSDGIGKISSELAARVAQKCRIKDSTPSAFQIRYGGYKGVVAVDPTSVMKLSLRESMSKYPSSNIKLDVLSWSKFQPCFLNRQIITLLSTLDVSDHIFEKKQRESVHNLDMILTDSVKAYETLQIMAPKESVNVLKEMLLGGYKPDAEPFLSMMLQTFRELKLFELRNKARIFVPNGRTLMGCLDETRTLEYGQVFVQVSHINLESFNLHMPITQYDNRSDKSNYICECKVVVAKNPCLHPGDVRVLQAVNVPSLHHMVDCVVFPQKGQRPHPNECSGSDLDGDLYFVSWDPELIPPRQASPMDYSPAPNVLLDRDVMIEEVEEYFTNYIVNDSLGKIANSHTAFADKEPAKAESQSCIELAKLFSIAVDFPKTGVPAVIPSHLNVKEFPDFMEKLSKPTYESQRVIGKLFREVKDIPQTSCIRSFTREVAIQSYDHDMEVDGFKNYLEDARYYKGEYDFKLGNLMDYYEIKTEAEIFCGSIMKLKKSLNSKKDVESIGVAVKSLKKEARTWFEVKSSTSDTQKDDVYAKASAWYHVTYHPDYWGCYNEGMNRNHFLSFPWCIYKKLIHIKKMKNKTRVSNPSRRFPWCIYL